MELVDPQSRPPHELGTGGRFRHRGRRRGHGSRALVASTILALALALACGGGDAPPEPRSDAAPSPADGSSDLLPTPYSADEIRDAWVEGLSLLVTREGPDGEAHERWTVVAADADGATVEYLPVGPDGLPAGEATSSRSTWVELRDHASFPAELATRERVTRVTPLGTLEGWLYRVRDEGAGSVTEYFFADDTPGAPVEMVSTIDGRRVAAMAQLERTVPSP